MGPRRRRFRPAGGTGVSDQQREHEHGDSRSNALIIGSVVAAGQRRPLIDVGHQLGVPSPTRARWASSLAAVAGVAGGASVVGAGSVVAAGVSAVAGVSAGVASSPLPHATSTSGSASTTSCATAIGLCLEFDEPVLPETCLSGSHGQLLTYWRRARRHRNWPQRNHREPHPSWSCAGSEAGAACACRSVSPDGAGSWRGMVRGMK